MTVRMDSELKKSFDDFCSQFGLSANAAMNVFAKAVVQRGRIPFDVVSDEVAAAERAQMAVDKYFSDSKLGIYVDGSYSSSKRNYEYDWRRPINFEYFNGEG